MHYFEMEKKSKFSAEGLPRFSCLWCSTTHLTGFFDKSNAVCMCWVFGCMLFHDSWTCDIWSFHVPLVYLKYVYIVWTKVSSTVAKSGASWKLHTQQVLHCIEGNISLFSCFALFSFLQNFVCCHRIGYLLLATYYMLCILMLLTLLLMVTCLFWVVMTVCAVSLLYTSCRSDFRDVTVAILCV